MSADDSIAHSAVTLLSADDFKKSVVMPWVDLSRDLSQASKSLNMLRKQKKKQEEQMMAWMMANDFECVKTPLGSVKVISKEVKSAVTRDFMVAQLKDSGINELQAATLATNVFENRPVTNKRKLTVVKPGKKQKTSDE